MYGHGLIENINEAYSKSKNKDFSEKIQTIKDSQHFYMGDLDGVLSITDKIFNNAELSHTGFFTGDLGENTKAPFDKMCMYCDVKSFQEQTVLKYDGFDSGYSPVDNKISRAAYCIHSIDNSIYLDMYSYLPYYKYWMCCPYTIVLTMDDNNENTYLSIKNRPGFGLDIPKPGRDASFDSVIHEKVWHLNAMLMLLNTKNITTIDNPPPAKLNKKRIKNGKQPLFTYKTLRLQLPAKKRKKGSGPVMPNDNTTRLHLCRGHFKTYTEEKPLLGRFTGRYWWQPHARGDKTKGVVMKDYEVKI